MKNDELLDLLGEIDPQFVIATIKLDESLKKSRKRTKVAISLCVACIFLLIGTLVVWKTSILNTRKAETFGNESISDDWHQSESITITEVPMAASPLDRMIDNLNSLYSSSSYKPGDIIECVYMPFPYTDKEDVSYSWNLQLFTSEKRIVGNYEERFLNEDGSAYEATKAEISGVILKPFTRVNDYSYRSEIALDTLQSNKMDYDDVTEAGIPIHYHFTDKMEAFESPDELVLYLPNTPKDVIPDCMNQSWIYELMDSDSEYTQRFFIFNTNDNVMYLADVNPPIPETKIPESKDIQDLLGVYKTRWEDIDHDGLNSSQIKADCTIYYDSVNREYKLDLVIGDSIVFVGMDVLQRKTDMNKDGDLQFVAFGKEENSGKLIFLLLDFITGDESPCKPLSVTIAESDVPMLPVNTFFTLTKE